MDIKQLTLALNDAFKGQLIFKQENTSSTACYFWQLVKVNEKLELRGRNDGLGIRVLLEDAKNLEEIIDAINLDS